MKNSFFDGTPLQLIGWTIVICLLSTVTFGIGFPWGFCMMERWKAKHTVVSSARLKFIGTGAELFWIWIFYAMAPYLAVAAAFGAIVILFRPFIESVQMEIWAILIAAIAIVYYAFFVKVQIQKWTAKHTEFESYPTNFPAPSATPAVTPTPNYQANAGDAAAIPGGKEINGFLSLGMFFFGVPSAIAGLVFLFLGEMVTGGAIFVAGLILLLVCYFNQ